jgi:short-subunit dehydrogenase
MKRIVIITGASSGLGREFVRQIPAERHADEIWLLARRKDKLDALALELETQGQKGTSGPKPRVVEIDLGGRKGIYSFSAMLEKERRANVDGGIVIDALVNNAGFGTYGTFRETGLDRQLEMIDLNVLTLTGLCHAAIPYMAKGSLIVNVASLASFIPLGNFAVYAATKAYVLSFSTALAAELADEGIFVSTVCPGPVDTEFANVASRGAREKVVDGESPSDVVAHCLRQIRKRRHSAIMAPKWKFKAFMSRFVGRYLFARHSFIHDKRPSK